VVPACANETIVSISIFAGVLIGDLFPLPIWWFTSVFVSHGKNGSLKAPNGDFFVVLHRQSAQTRTATTTLILMGQVVEAAERLECPDWSAALPEICI
jgi:hypothetical protein